MRYLRGFLVAGLAWLAAGCMQFEYGIELEDDLSGTANLDVEIDLERVAYMAAYVQNAFEGEGGEPSEEQIEAARQEILADMDDEDLSEDSLRAEIEPDLPEGVELVYARVNRQDLLTTMNMKFQFDHVDKLKEMKLDDDDDGDDGGMDSEPFENLEITDDGNEIIIRSEPINPMEEMDDMSWLSDEMVEKMLEGFGVTFWVATPFDVQEHNATRTEGNKLIWVFNLETLKAEEPVGIFARFKR